LVTADAVDFQLDLISSTATLGSVLSPGYRIADTQSETQ